MTCIVGLATNGRVFIGADSAGVSGHDVAIRADEKVFIKDQMIFGFTDSFRMGQLIKHSLSIPFHDPLQDCFEYLTVPFVNELRSCLTKGGFASKRNEVETGGNFLLGYRGRLFQVCDDFQVGERLDRFDAVGSGSSIALGALFAMGRTDFGPALTVELALAASAHLNSVVRAPFKIKCLDSRATE